MDRIAPTKRPSGKNQGTQRWHRLLFSHWEVPAAELKALVHPRLTIDTFEGRAFVGAVAFTMQNVKPFGFAVPTATTFYEINVRTYVHLDGEEPGVVFFSLDSTSTLATLAARSVWGVPYHRSSISLVDDGTAARWSCDRLWPKPAAPRFEASFAVGAPLPASRDGTLEFFLAERYQFYAPGRGGRLRRARVHHVPYPLHAVERCEVGPSLVTPLQLMVGARTPDLFSPGVDVEMFALEDVR